MFALGGLQETNFWGAGNSSQQAGAQKELGCAGVRMESVVSTSGDHRMVVTGPGPGLRDHREVTGAEYHPRSSHTQDAVQLCNRSQKQSKNATARTRKRSLLLPARCPQRLLLTKLNTVLSVKEEKCLKNPDHYRKQASRAGRHKLRAEKHKLITEGKFPNISFV